MASDREHKPAFDKHGCSEKSMSHGLGGAGRLARRLRYWSVLQWAVEPTSGIELPQQFAWEDSITITV